MTSTGPFCPSHNAAAVRLLPSWCAYSSNGNSSPTFAKLSASVRTSGSNGVKGRICGLLFAGTHELEQIFTRQALELEQWRSRFHAGQALPGISDEEAATIVHSELGLGLSQRKIQKLISKSRITDLRNGGQHSYVSARRLFWVIRELQAAANRKSTHASHQ